MMEAGVKPPESGKRSPRSEPQAEHMCTLGLLATPLDPSASQSSEER